MTRLAGQKCPITTGQKCPITGQKCPITWSKVSDNITVTYQYKLTGARGTGSMVPGSQRAPARPIELSGRLSQPFCQSPDSRLTKMGNRTLAGSHFDAAIRLATN